MPIPIGSFVIIPDRLAAGVISEHNPPPPQEYMVKYHFARAADAVDAAQIIQIPDNQKTRFLHEQNGYCFKWEVIVNKGKVIPRIWARPLANPGGRYQPIPL